MYNRNHVFIASCLGMLLFGVSLITLGSILPGVIRQFSLSEMQAGSLASLLPFGILLGSVVFGPIVDRSGYKLILTGCSLLVVAALEGIAFANTFLLLQASIFFIGLGGGVINGGTNALVADISSEDKGAKLSLLGVFFAIGALGMPVVLGFLSKYYSTQTILSMTGAFLLIPVFFFMMVRFPAPKHSQGFPVRQGIAMVKDSTLLLMGFFLFFESALEGIVNNWTTTIFERGMNVSGQNSLYALSTFVAGMAVTRLVLGFGLIKLKWQTVLYASMSLVVIGALVLLFAESYLTAILALIILGIGFAAGFPVMLGVIGERYASLSGTAFSVAITIALIGNMALNYLAGLVSQVFGVKSPVGIILCGALIMIVIIYAVNARLNRKDK